MLRLLSLSSTAFKDLSHSQWNTIGETLSASMPNQLQTAAGLLGVSPDQLLSLAANLLTEYCPTSAPKDLLSGALVKDLLARLNPGRDIAQDEHSGAVDRLTLPDSLVTCITCSQPNVGKYPVHESVTCRHCGDVF